MAANTHFMKRFILFLLLCSLQSVFAQNKAAWQKQFSTIDSAYMAVRENNLKEAFRLAMKEDSIANLLQADSLQLLARFHKSQTLILLGFFDQALKELYDGLKKAEKTGSVYFQYRYNYSIGQVYNDIGDTANTMKYYQAAKKKAIENRSLKDTIFINYDIGIALLYRGDTINSLAIISKNLEVSKMLEDSVSLFFGFDNMAQYYAVTGNMKQSLLYEKEIFKHPKTFNNAYRKNLLYQHLSEIASGLGDWPKAQEYCDSLFVTARQFNSPDWFLSCCQMQAKIDEAKGNYKGALKNQQRSMELNDSLRRNSYATKMTVMANLYELGLKQDEIENLSKDKKLSAAKIQSLSLLLIALLLIATLVALFILYRKNKNEKLLKDKFASQLLSTQEEERQRLARDLHDSVGQNILFIKNQLQVENRNEPLLLKSVDDALEEVRNISKDLYPNQLEKYGLSAAVDALGEQVKASSGIFISSDMGGIDEALNKNAQINFYRIIQEFVNNTLKHANATAIRITAEQTRHEIKLIVQDNGKGFDKAEIERRSGKSFGLLNMEERVKILKGKFEIESETGKGTKSVFTIPV
jgi:signal transduction histidine kinase